jgi:hypothetical protein
VGEPLILGRDEGPTHRAIGGIAIGPDHDQGRQLLARIASERLAALAPLLGLIGPPRLGRRALQPSSAPSGSISRPFASIATTSRSSPISPPGKAAGATGSRTTRVAPSILTPKWISIMKNVMSWSTTSSSGVRFGLK